MALDTGGLRPPLFWVL